jgi:uncharacterized membrane protein
VVEAGKPTAGAPFFDAAERSNADISALARGVGAWALVTGSLAYATALFAVPKLVDLVGKNRVAAEDRGLLLESVVASVVGAVAVGSVAFVKHRAGTAALLTTGRVALPLALTGPAVALLASDKLELSPRVSAMAALVLLLERALRISFGEIAAAEGGPFASLRVTLDKTLRRLETARIGRVRVLDVVVVLLALAYAAYAAFFTVRRHHHFGTMSNDLGQYDNFFYNALHGHPFRSTPLVPEGNWSALRSHAEFAMYALLPFYALYPHAETLLVLQSVLLGSAAIPIYRFASRQTSRVTALALALAYLLYAPLHGANFYDLHFQPIGAAFSLWALDFLAAKKRAPFVVAFVLALAAREDVPLIFMAAGAYLVLSGRAARAGIALAAVAGAYFCVMKFAVMPHFGTWWYQHIYKGLFPPNDETYGGVIKTLVSNPVFSFGTLVTEKKLGYALLILTPLAFLPLRGRWLWLSIVPGSFVTLLTTEYNPTVEITFQYSAYLIALIFPASALALAALGQAGPERRRAAVGALLTGTLLTTTAWGAVPPRAHFRAGYIDVDFEPVSEHEKRKNDHLLELAALVPPSASLAVSEHELPHVSGRTKCFDLKDDFFGADYLLYERESGGNGTEQAKKALATGDYDHLAERGSIILLKNKNYSPPSNWQPPRADSKVSIPGR